MPDERRVKCRICSRRVEECGPVSWRGYCGECGTAKATAAATEMHYHSGPFFERWRVNIAASVGAVIPDKP